jgi:hypothetical protein
VQVSRDTHLRAAGPTYRVLPITRMPRGIRALANEFPEYEIRAYLQKCNGWTAHMLDPINWTAYRAAISALTDQVHWLPVAFGNTETALRLTPAGNVFNSKQYVTCTSATLEQIGVTNSSISLRNTSNTYPLQPTFDTPR